MKKLFLLLILLFGMISCIPEDVNEVNGEDTKDPDEIVVFPDPGLEQCVRDELQKKDGYLTHGDLRRIGSMNCSGRSISDLSGIENIPNLWKVFLSGNKIKDVTPLGKCVKLRELEISHNEIEDATPLENLVNLEKLIIQGNQITNIEFIRNMTVIERLYVDNNPIKLIPKFEKQLQLKSISFGQCKLQDVVNIGQFSQVEWLMLYNNNILNINEIKMLLNLRQTNIKNNCITDFSPIDYLKENGSLTIVSGDSPEEQDYGKCE